MTQLLPGRPLLGFYGLFEEDYGDEATAREAIVVTPSKVGSALLPFRCPKCQEVPQELACPVTREHYRDPRPGGGHHCPRCGCRFQIDLRGTPLTSTLPAGAKVGPSLVERAGKTYWQDRSDRVTEGVHATVRTILGALFGRPAVRTSGYAVLGLRAQAMRRAP